MLDNDNSLTIQGVYNTLYNATTRPDFKFAVTRYFIDEWVPLLGPSLAWLVVGLRQQCYWNRRRNWCIVDKSTLADETALDKRTIERALKKPYSRWFVAEVTQRYRYRHQLGKKVRDKNRYQLILDEPLSPRHQLGLAALLRATPPAASDRLDAALTTVGNIIDLPHLSDKLAYSGGIPKNLERRTILQLVEEALELNLTEHANDERVVLLDHRCAQLHNLIVQPNKIYMGWQYYRLKWVPLLGHALAWLIIYLRRQCYWDEVTGELRDTHTAYKKELAAAIGQTTRNLANLMDTPHTSLFFTILNPDASRNQQTSYQIRLVDEPLTPEDQQKIAFELRQQLQGNFYEQDPESGQLSLFPMVSRFSSGRQNFAYGQLSENVPFSDPKNRRFDQQLPEKMSQQDPRLTGKNAATKTDDSLILSDSKKLPEQQKQFAAAHKQALQTLLDDLSIQEPVRSKLLATPNLTVTKVGAWYLYAETQPGLFDPRSYVIKRLLANDPPPAEFLAFARLDDRQWEMFEEAVQMLHHGTPMTFQIPANLTDTFINWASVYGHLDPADTRRLLAASQTRVTAAANASDSPLTPAEAEAQAVWQAALAQLQLQMARETFNMWLQNTQAVTVQNSTLVIDAGSAYAREWLEKRLAPTIERAVSAVAEHPLEVRFTVSSD